MLTKMQTFSTMIGTFKKLHTEPFFQGLPYDRDSGMRIEFPGKNFSVFALHLRTNTDWTQTDTEEEEEVGMSQR